MRVKKKERETETQRDRGKETEIVTGGYRQTERDRQKKDRKTDRQRDRQRKKNKRKTNTVRQTDPKRQNRHTDRHKKGAVKTHIWKPTRKESARENKMAEGGKKINVLRSPRGLPLGLETSLLFQFFFRPRLTEI